MQEPGIAPKDCKGMLGRYKNVLAQVMSKQAKGTLPRAPVAP